MTRNDRLVDLVTDWLEDQPDKASDRLLDSVLTDLQTAPQRGRWRVALRRFPMFGSTSLRVATAFGAVALVAVLGLAMWGGRGAVGPGASPVSSEQSSPQPTMITLRSAEKDLSAGTYRVDDGSFPPFVLTVPDGWRYGDGLVNRPRSGQLTPPVSVQFWGGPTHVYRHPCQWQGSLFEPGPSVDDFAQALVDQPLRNATEPVDVTLGGYAGKYLELSVPSDMDFSECDVADGENRFFSWDGRYHQGPGQVDRLWILDVDGSRLVIDAFQMPYATAEERAEQQAVVESVEFER